MLFLLQRHFSGLVKMKTVHLFDACLIRKAKAVHIPVCPRQAGKGENPISSSKHFFAYTLQLEHVPLTKCSFVQRVKIDFLKSDLQEL